LAKSPRRLQIPRDLQLLRPVRGPTGTFLVPPEADPAATGWPSRACRVPPPRGPR